MKVSFTELHAFGKVREDLFHGDESFRLFQNALMDNPRAGDVIEHTGGARKIRWMDPGRGKGKRSGIRVIYLYIEEAVRIYLLFAYDKNTSDLTEDQKSAIARTVRLIRTETARS